MPTYEYVCRSCDYEFEAFQSMRDAVLQDCPECGEASLKRKIGTGAGILFKGSGFYETDYKKPAGEKKEGGESGSKESATAEKPEKKETVKAGDSGTKSGPEPKKASTGS